MVGGIPDKFAELISVDALRFVVDAYRASLSFDHTLQQVLSHRKLKRRELDQAARSGRRMSDVSDAVTFFVRVLLILSFI